MGKQTWSNHLDYVLSLLGFSIGVATFLKFPFLCMKNGGGAFLIPYILFTVIGGIPLVCLEMVIGQFSQSGAVEAWNLCPPFKGLGITALTVSFGCSSYYPTFYGWTMYYLYHSFFPKLPWVNCDQDWNTPSCISFSEVVNTTEINARLRSVAHNSTINRTNTGITAGEEFWTEKVLHLSDGLNNAGNFNWPVIGCLTFIYLTIFVSIFRGLKVSGKVVYVTVTVPYILVTVLLIRACLLPGSAEGIYYYMYPKFDRLLDSKVWIQGCSLALFSVGVGYGCIITMAGHNKLNRNCLRDAILMCVVDLISTVYIGLAFFASLGYIAHQKGVTVESFQSSGFSLGFVVFPQAMSSLPLPQLWCVMLFLMLLTLGYDSIVPMLEVVVTAVEDHFPRLAKRRWLVSGAVVIVAFLLNLPYTTQGGIYALTLVDHFLYFPSISIIVSLECIVVCWVYGTDRLDENVQLMLGRRTPKALTICAKYVCPVLFMCIFGYSVYSYRPPKYEDYIYPEWANVIGWMISTVPVLPLPIVFLWTWLKTDGESVMKKLKLAMKPNRKWGLAAARGRETDEIQASMIPLKE